MKRKKEYFSHDYNARSDKKILALRSKYGWEGYGMFWALIEFIAEHNGKIEQSDAGAIAVELQCKEEFVFEFISFCISKSLLKEKNGVVYSERMINNLKLREAVSKKRKKAAEKRWSN